MEVEVNVVGVTTVESSVLVGHTLVDVVGIGYYVSVAVDIVSVALGGLTNETVRVKSNDCHIFMFSSSGVDLLVCRLSWTLCNLFWKHPYYVNKCKFHEKISLT